MFKSYKKSRFDQKRKFLRRLLRGAGSPFGTCCEEKDCGAQHSATKTQLQLDFQFMSLSLSTTGFPKEQYDHLPAVRVVPVEGKVVCEPGVDVIEAHLLTGRIGQGLIITIIN